MFKRIPFWIFCLLCVIFSPNARSLAQEDKIARITIETVRTQMRVPKEIGVKFIEKKESPIPGFFSVKILISAPDQDIPLVAYVDRAEEKVIIGNLFIKGINVTRKEAGEPKPRKIVMGELEMVKAPWRGSAEAKATIVEFSNFQCSYCMRSWIKMKEFLDKYPDGIKYIFKHFPFQSQQQSMDFSIMVASVQEVSNEAFWIIHDFMFSDEGQTLANADKRVVKERIEAILKEKGYDVRIFQNALETGTGQRRVEEDMALGRRIRVTGTPTAILNGNFIIGPLAEKVLEQFVGK